jgi:hypothetical protein
LEPRPPKNARQAASLCRSATRTRLAKAALEALGGVDIWISNAGGAEEGIKPWLDTEAA